MMMGLINPVLNALYNAQLVKVLQQIVLNAKWKLIKHQTARVLLVPTRTPKTIARNVLLNA